MNRRFLGVVAGTSLALTAAVTLAQTRGGEPDGDMATLVGEVRLLRQAVERAASISPRIEIGLQLLRIEDERVARLSRETAALQDELGSLTSQLERMAAGQRGLEEALRTEADPERRAQLEQEIRGVKASIDVAAAREQQLRPREQEAAATLQAAEFRWRELEAQVDTLRRMIEKPQ
jgi:chromosome segregation ATPase